MICEEETTEGFQGEYDFLSNMYPFEVEYRGLTFASSEHLYQWLKVDPNTSFSQLWRDKIRHASNGRIAKKITKESAFPFRPVDDVDEFRLKAMKIALWAKFKQREMADKLLSTDDIALVEHNYWKDDFFGVYQGVGQNHLGRLLMELRMYLRANYDRLFSANNTSSLSI